MQVYHEYNMLSGKAQHCEQECYTMQSFSVIGIIFVFIATVGMIFPAHDEWRMAAGCSAFVGFVAYVIVFSVAISQYGRNSTFNSLACSYGDDHMDVKLGSSFVLFVIASILSLFQMVVAFSTRNVHLVTAFM